MPPIHLCIYRHPMHYFATQIIGSTELFSWIMTFKYFVYIFSVYFSAFPWTDDKNLMETTGSNLQNLIKGPACLDYVYHNPDMGAYSEKTT